MPFDFRAIRSWNGSQHEAFEEMSCQLAYLESMPAGAVFRRKHGAGGDAGVECYWRLADDREHCWQAKYFLTLGDSQWKQLDDSVTTALDKHPRLITYTICLPINLTDARISGQRSTQERWDTQVAKWSGWAAERGMDVEFILWGQFALVERLTRSQPPYTGRAHFWFNEQELGSDWFARRFDEARANVGPRYTPELHVTLPEARLFDGLARSESFFARLRDLYGTLARRLAQLVRWENRQEHIPEAMPLLDDLREQGAALTALLKQTDREIVRPIEFDRIATLASAVDDLAYRCHEALRPAERSDERSAATPSDQRTREFISSMRHDLLQVRHAAREIHTFATDDAARAANRGALLLLGEAGTGKTHLLCDVAASRLAAGLPTILLLGQQFADGEPWGQAISLLNLTCKGQDEFLGALDAAGQARNCRALILIDALNEGTGKTLWRKHLAGMLRGLQRYPHIAIALTCRTGYETIVIPEGMTPDSLVKTTHRGFASHEYVASRTFFDHYGIERPSVPLLVPEFSNPLFLKLFCEGLHKRGLRRVPTGLAGITAVFGLFIDTINRTLAHPERLDYAERSKPVHRALAALARRMAESGRPWVAWEEAETLVNGVLPRTGEWAKSLFAGLLSEGLLSEDLGYVPRSDSEEQDNYIEAIRFPYEKFADHLVVSHLLDTHLDVADPTGSFAQDMPLGRLLTDERDAWINAGWIEALCIQLPERIGRELGEVAPHSNFWQPVRRGFLESLIWRDHTKITDATIDYLNEVIRLNGVDEVYDVVLTLAGTPGHRLNAASLHRHLLDQKMPDRDQLWSTYLHHQHGIHGPVDRLIKWAWEAEKAHISDESAELCAVALAWFLTTPNRFVRDRATKALVALLSPRPRVVISVLERFASVDDPYVLERLYAVAYGVAMTCDDNSAVAQIAGAIYTQIFAGGHPPTHLMLRDYARGVIELAVARGVLPAEIDLSLVRPPYRSDWPLAIPSDEEHSALRQHHKDAANRAQVRLHIRSSIVDFGDFGTYVIKPRVGHWSARPLGTPHQPTKRQLFRRFENALTPRQRRMWDRYLAVQASYAVSNIRLDETEPTWTDEEWLARLARAETAFLKTLGLAKRRQVDEVVVPYFAGPTEDRPHFDPSMAQRWIFKRVFDLGWTADRFGQFDDAVNRIHNQGRSPDKPERMGKKYQWIALHEFLAHMADNLEFIGDSWSEEPQTYQGPWQISARDIDPSLLLRELVGDKDTQQTGWWQPVDYAFGEVDPQGLDTWLTQVVDLPDPRAMLQVTRPDDSTRWLLLENSAYRWLEASPVEVEPEDYPRRHLVLLIWAYLVRRKDADEEIVWLAQQDLFGRWMPEAPEAYHAFIGEYPWAASWHELASAGIWRRDRQDQLPHPVIVPTISYTWSGSSFDCSVEGSIVSSLPSPWLTRELGLRWAGRGFRFVDSASETIAISPAAEDDGPSAALAAQERIQQLIAEHDLELFWIVFGEREIWQDVRKEWPGRLTISGVYRLRDGKCEGGLSYILQGSKGERRPIPG